MRLRLSRGPAKIVFENHDANVHTFTVDGLGLDVELGPLEIRSSCLTRRHQVLCVPVSEFQATTRCVER